MTAGHHTRRELLTRAALAGGVALGASAGSPSGAGAVTAAPAQSDAQLLSAVLAIELLAEFVLQAVLKTGVLSARPEEIVRTVLGHEQAHARLITGELARLGGSPPAAPSSLRAADELLVRHHVSRQLTGLAKEQDAIKLLVDLESLAERTYYDRMSQFSGTQLLRTAAQILCDEAQHYTALAQLLRPDKIYKSVPDAFVEGNHSV